MFGLLQTMGTGVYVHSGRPSGTISDFGTVVKVYRNNTFDLEMDDGGSMAAVYVSVTMGIHT